MKKCNKCKELLSIQLFGKHRLAKDGLNPRCKVCNVKHRMEYYNKNKPLEQAKSRLYNRNNPEKHAISRKRWIHNNPIKYRETVQKLRANSLLERRARKRHNYHVNKGNIIRQPCEVSNERCRGSIEAHHCDYSKPLDVMWLCKTHHAAWHRIFLVN